jgi:phosphatidate cytidylyltransferase
MLRTRILSALVMGAIVIGALLWLPPRGWAAFMLAVLLVAGWEWGAFARLAGAGRIVCSVVLGAACVAAGAWAGVLDGTPVEGRSALVYGAALVFWLVGGTWWLARNPPHPGPWLVLLCAPFALVPAYVAALELRSRGIVVFLLVGGVVWAADVAAYFAGRAFGKRKLAPAISPGKTWEGVYGALAAVGVYALVAGGFFARAADVPEAVAVIVPAALVLGAASVVGDLFESALKRQAGMKDSGRILPGHGGVLDRIDALIPVLPLAMLGTLWLGRGA